MSKKNYIQPADFFREMLISLKKDEISDELAKMFMLLAERYANHPNYVRFFHIRDDIISECMLACVKGFPKFRPYRTKILERDEEGNILRKEIVEWHGEIVEYNYLTCNNPHAYFTTCMKHVLFHFLKNEYTERNVVNKMKLELGLEADPAYMDMISEQERKAILEDRYDGDDDDFDDEDVIEWENEQ